MEKSVFGRITKKDFGKMKDGVEISEFVLSNAHNITVSLISWGASVRSILLPDRTGKAEEITLGFDELAPYIRKHPFLGATIGRVANRIAGSSFSIDGKVYKLTANEKKNQLHGGKKGFDRVVWQAEPFSNETGCGVHFSYLSRDGEEGYPGNLQVLVTYRLTAANELIIEYEAETDKVTPVNLTNHTYWNLCGAGSGTIFSHVLKVNAGHYLPVDRFKIPSGEIAPVKHTPMDFRTAKSIGQDFKELKRGYDHCLVLDPNESIRSLTVPAAEVHDPVSGRGLRIYTDQPGIQLYTGNFIRKMRGANGKIFRKHGALCLETQNFPDAVHHANFPTPFLQPGVKYRQKTIHQFFIA